MVVEDIIQETIDTRTYRLRFKDEEGQAERFTFRAGQFGEYSVFGAGESTFCIASPPTRTGYIECTVKAAGKLTGTLAEVNVGDVLGFRGPMNIFPVDEWEGRNLVFIAGGIGLAPVRCVIWDVLDQRQRFGDVTIVYGARSVGDLVYKRELEEWAGRDDVRLVTTVDPGGETPEWTGEVGYVTPVVEQAAPSPDNAVVALCGPPIVVKLTLPVLERRAAADPRPREPHEVRPRQVRPLQHRLGLRLQGRSGLHRGADQGAAPGVLDARTAGAGRPRLRALTAGVGLSAPPPPVLCSALLVAQLLRSFRLRPSATPSPRPYANHRPTSRSRTVSPTRRPALRLFAGR